VTLLVAFIMSFSTAIVSSSAVIFFLLAMCFFVMWNILIPVPVIFDKIHRLTTGIVFAIVFVPVLLVIGRYTQVDWLDSPTLRHRLYNYRLWVDVFRPWSVAAAELEVVPAAAEFSPEVVFVAVVSAPDVAEPQVSVDIAVAFVVLVPVSVVAVERDSSGRPKFLAFPNVDYFASSSSSAEVVGWESFHSPTGAHTNHGFYRMPHGLLLHKSNHSHSDI
jgi:hypothetical protein